MSKFLCPKCNSTFDADNNSTKICCPDCGAVYNNPSYTEKPASYGSQYENNSARFAAPSFTPQNQKYDALFKKIDKHLVFCKRLLSVLAILSVILFAILAILQWVAAAQTHATIYILNGFIYLIVGSVASFAAYKIGMCIVSFFADVKLIRNKMYDVQTSEQITSLFEEDTIKDYTNKDDTN